MPRTPAAAPRKASKRPVPDTDTDTAPPAPSSATRHSKRARRGPATPKSYAEPTTDTDGESAAASASDDASDYDGAGAATTNLPASASSASDQDEDDEDDQEDDDDESPPPKRRAGTKKQAPSKSRVEASATPWKPGAKLTPGTQLIIKKPRARDAGDTPYADERIHPNTMLFLEELAANNNRPWLKLHDVDFRTSFQDFTSFTEKLSERIIEIDETIPELPVKDVIYRIYRDIRFSKDPTPYKTYFSASWSRTGRKGPYAGYYVQVQPGGGSFVGGGLWQPDAGQLSALRRAIDGKPHKLKRVLGREGIRKTFLGGVGEGAGEDRDDKVVEAFVRARNNASTALKRNPKGYDIDHRDISLLRLRSFTLGTKVRDDDIVGTGGLERVCSAIHDLEPFITYLNSVVMPDGDSSGSEDAETATETGDD